MLFWITAALLTAGACLAVLLPLRSGRAGDAAEADHDVEVYRDQLLELDRETERGLMNPAEAEEARAEIARRILRADGRLRQRAAAHSGMAARVLGSAAVIAVPLLSWGIYAAIGSPDLPSQPLSARLMTDPAASSMADLVARAEAHLAANPSDSRGWDVLAPVYLRLGRFPDAVQAYSNAIRLDGATAARELGLGEALAGAAGGLVTADSRAAFERALQLQPDLPQARFYLATALAQEGRMEDAVAAWQKMLDGLPADAPWRGAVEAAVAEGRQRLSAAASKPGPEPEDIEAASRMSESDRNAMIETMVASLDERLKNNPKDLEGWLRLVRSYVVLGRTEAARDAAGRATKAFGENSEEARRIAELIATLGLPATVRE